MNKSNYVKATVHRVAVARFLEGSLAFTAIPHLLAAAVDRFGTTGTADPDLAELITLDESIRRTFATTAFGDSP